MTNCTSKCHIPVPGTSGTVNHTYAEGCRLATKGNAYAAEGYPVETDWTDTDEGHRWIHLRLDAPFDFDKVQKLPKVLAYDGDIFSRTGWNSDKGVVYYRNHMPIAQGV